MKIEEIPDIILGLKSSDLQLRDKLIKRGELFNGYHEEMEKLHNQNGETLNDIISQIGYPTIDKVGKEASDAAWLVIQHAISQPAFMRMCRNLLEEAVLENKADPLHLAYLTDRIASYEEKPQLYGTQFDWDENGELSPRPYDDLRKVNERRKSVGLNSLKEQTELIRSQAKEEHHLTPEDLEKRQREIREWKIRVGWILTETESGDDDNAQATT